ncbi:MAG TPA: prepilin-type N-terminal cleavage/methylation domain-containing protein, partial [Myxococcota bacterium]|nr:prepilin-type N-terminal cleavage/methylation domain-containing protein [Myxococcota bacterium]
MSAPRTGPRAGHRRAERGLTLLEILVSLVATMVVLAGLFTIVSAGSKGFIAQSQIAELQINLRFAMERIKSDLRLAAFLGTPDSNADARVCPKPAPVLQALRILDAVDTAPNPGANPFIVTDRLRLLGSFVSSDYYLTDSIVGTTFTLQPLNLPTTAARY